MNTIATKTLSNDTLTEVDKGAQYFSAKVLMSNDLEQDVIGQISFDVSDNEEQIVLMIEVDDQEVLVDSEQCLYMLLLLARARMIDQVSGLDDAELGWLSIGKFSVMLGCKQQMFYPSMLRFTNTWQQKIVDNAGHSEILQIPALVEIDEHRLRFAYDNIQINCSNWCL